MDREIPCQQEILRYLNFCVETLNLRGDIYLNERVSDAAGMTNHKYGILNQFEKNLPLVF